MKRLGKIIAALLLPLPTALVLAGAISFAVEVGSPYSEEYPRVVYGVPIASWAFFTIWLLMASTGRQTISRGCGGLALAAFSLPVSVIVAYYLWVPKDDPGFIGASFLFAFLAGVPLGAISLAGSLKFRKPPQPPRV